MLHHYADEALEEADHYKVERFGMDETTSRRGHNYVTLFYELDEKLLLYGTEGREQGVVRAFSKDLRAHGGELAQIRQACSDMWPAYIRGVEECFPEGEITFDRFHTTSEAIHRMKILNSTVDQVRREESKRHPICG